MATRGDAASRVASAASGGRTGRARGAGFGASTRSLISSTSFWISSSSSAVAGVVVSAWRTRSKVEPRNARYPAAGWMAREAPGTVRHALEAREARDVDDIRAAFALHDVEPEEIDSECRSATSRDVLELGSEGERLTPLFLGSAPRANPDYAEPLAPERVDLAVRRPVRRVVALGEYRLLHGPERRQLGGVRDHRTATQPGAAVRPYDQRSPIERREELAGVGRDEGLGHRHPGRSEDPERHDPVAQQHRDRVGIQERGAGAVEIRRHAHSQVLAVLEHVQVVVEAHPRDVDQVVAEMQRSRRGAELAEQADHLRHAVLVRERASQQNRDSQHDPPLQCPLLPSHTPARFRTAADSSSSGTPAARRKSWARPCDTGSAGCPAAARDSRTRRDSPRTPPCPG